MRELKGLCERHCMELLLLVMVCLWGGYYEFVSAVYSLLFLCGLVLICRKEGKIRIPMHVTTWCLAVIFVCYAVAVVRAADKGIALLGLIKIMSVVLFWIFWNNLSEWRKTEMFLAVPRVGAAVTAVALVGYFHPYLQHYLYRANRLGGIFQYSNTYAMFLLVGLLLLVYKQDWTKEKGSELVILFLGIIFTGSRSVFVLMFLSVTVVLVIRKWKKVLIIWGCLSVIALAVAQSFLRLDIGRLLEITLSAETFNMRLLYYKDGIDMVLKNPLGLGYMGYYFLQPQFQTGYYTTKFVHNDLLQCALDAGVIAAMALVVMVSANIFTKRNTEIKRILLILLFLHGMFDFDQQFSVMYCLLLMCMEESDGDVKWVEAGRIWMRGAVLVLGCVSLYFAVALGAAYGRNYTLALRLYPSNTLAAIPQVKAGDREEAERVISQNGMTVSAYDIASQAALEARDYQCVLKNVREMLRCSGYYLYYYNHAVYYLRDAWEIAKYAGDEECAEEILDEMLAVPQRLEELKEKTSAVAYRTAYPPEFELDADVRVYLYLLMNKGG